MERAELLAALTAFPDRVAAAARAAADRPVPDGAWGPEQVVRHLIAVERDVHQARFADLDREAEPHWSWAEPGPWPGEPGLSLDALLERFAAARAATLATLVAMDESWDRHGIHETFGRLDVAGLVRNAVDHDEDHLRGLA